MHHLIGCNGKLGAGSLGAIETLDLHSNDVGAAGAASLASALERNATLQALDLGRNGVGAAFRASLERVKSALSSGTRLRPLYH